MAKLEEIKNLVGKFSDESFGADRPFTSPLIFLKREVETTMETGNMEDFVDCFALLVDAYRKRFPNVPLQTLVDLCKEKIEVIIPARSWKKLDEFNCYDND